MSEKSRKELLGAEIWRGHAVTWYTVAKKDRAHFLAADGGTLNDTTAAMYRDDYARKLIEYDVSLGADGIDSIAKQLGMSYMQVINNLYSRRKYEYWRKAL